VRKEDDTKIKFGLDFSGEIGRIYAGEMEQQKDGVKVMTGKRYDVTQDFYKILLSSLPLGINVNGKPKYRVDMKEISE
jgi:hypothetical protein